MSAETITETLVTSSSWSPLWTALIGVVVALGLYEYWHRNTREYKMLQSIPTLPSLPLLGSAHLFLGLSNAEIVKKGLSYLDQIGETIHGWLGNVPLVFLTNPADIEIILSGYNHLTKAEEYRFFKPWFGDGLLISDGNHWRHHRKMIAPTFHQSILKSFVPTFVEHSKTVCERMGKEFGKEFDVHKYMSQTTVEILLTTAMGVKKLPENNKSAEYAQAVVDMCDIIHKRHHNLFYRIDQIYNLSKLRKDGDKFLSTILSMTDKVVAERKNDFSKETSGVLDDANDIAETKLKASKKVAGLRDDLDDIDENDVGAKRRLALLDAMVDMTKNPEIEWTEKDVRDEVNTIMFEGHDTTSAGSSFALCMMGIHQDIQEKVLAEQKAIFGNNMQRDCTFADTLEMKYLERVICETLRMYPPVPLIARKTTEDVKLASGPYMVPKGTTIVILQFCVHRRPDIFPNPDKFDPDNFLPERAAKRHYYSYIPFSAGPRSCVGRKFAMLKLKVLLSTIIRKYHVKANNTEKDFKIQADIILKLEDGFNIVLEPRKYAQTA